MANTNREDTSHKSPIRSSEIDGSSIGRLDNDQGQENKAVISKTKNLKKEK